MPTFGAQAKAYDGRTESIIGRAELPVQVAGVTHILNVALVNSMDDECLLGADFYRTFNAIVHPRENLLQIEGASERVALEAVTSGKSSNICSLQIGLSEVTELQREEIRQLVDRILPTGEVPVGCTSWAEHRIIVDESQRPVKQRYYPVSKKLEEDMHSQVRELLAAGHIRRSSSEWSSPVVMVRKANGSYRLCIDYRKLNAVTKVSAYPIPNMDIILRKLQSAKFITTLDLSAAFHQVPMSAGSEKYTAFTVPGLGLFEWTRMPYGVAGGPATFQELADKIIGPEMEPVAFAYIDDIIIATATYAEHLKWLEHVLKRINQAGLTINRDKSFFCRSEVKYLGVIVDKNGFRPDPDKIAPVTEMTAPKTLKQLRRFLGMASWYRKFLENFATIADPLNKLLKKNTKYIWGEEQQAAFERIKALIASAPMLSRPSFEHEFVVQTDASDSGLGAVLTQTIDGEEKVLCFASRTLNKAERNYSVTERECLAVLWAIQKFRPYVEGYRFRVITDHSSLRWLHNLRNPTGKLSRWSLELQQFDYIVEHRKAPTTLCRMHCLAYTRMKATKAQVASIIINEKAEDSWYNKLLAKCREKKRQQVLFECHEEPTSGHLGRHKTYERLAMRYYWPSAHRDVTKYVRECQICQQCKVQQLAPAGLMGRRAITRPWSVVAGDTMGPFPRSAQGKRVHHHLHGSLYKMDRSGTCTQSQRAHDSQTSARKSIFCDLALRRYFTPITAQSIKII
ncbi:unnamed protein product [Trichogramma brassicae]|uniref:RNA-directed DNA polymerase n=1 Tax=Trichogramma brassicae TaxID=86971 RepID=A0A6H5I8C5_9HYME|nr:unnamed protein product [Trichogramma brassicae]